MIIRENYLKRIRPFYDSELVKVLTGIRRCGKSTLLKQIIQELKAKGLPDAQILMINFEDYQFRPLFSPDALHQYVKARLHPDQKTYLFFDEIQNVAEFELVINSFRAAENVSIFITGSNSRLLSGELSTHLGGRTVSFTVMPFSFSEFCAFSDSVQDKEAHDRGTMFQEYVRWGGFPLVCAEELPENKALILSSLYDSIVLKDIILRHQVASPVMLDRLLSYVLGSSSLTLSGNRISGTLKTAGFPISSPMVYDYLRYMEEACIINRAQRYDIQGKKALSFEEKAYTVDFGLFQMKKNIGKDQWSMVVETAVYNELIARGYSVYVGKTNKGEVDFIARKDQQQIYIQAAYVMNTEQTAGREFGSLAHIKDQYPKYVVSLDPLRSDQEGIRHLNLLDFLQNETLIR